MKETARSIAFGFFFGAAVGAFLPTALFVLDVNRKHSDLIQQCIADGHKEYECVGILKGRNLQKSLK